ncbi:hypothetical protein KIN20_010931, partial [Parelaphostrongylus tenuis]
MSFGSRSENRLLHKSRGPDSDTPVASSNDRDAEESGRLIQYKIQYKIQNSDYMQSFRNDNVPASSIHYHISISKRAAKIRK